MKNKRMLALIEQIQRDLAKLKEQVDQLRAAALEDPAPEEPPGGP